jgi:hypothetical protein
MGLNAAHMTSPLVVFSLINAALRYYYYFRSFLHFSFTFAFSSTVCILHLRKHIPLVIWHSGIIIPTVCN